MREGYSRGVKKKGKKGRLDEHLFTHVPSAASRLLLPGGSNSGPPADGWYVCSSLPRGEPLCLAGVSTGGFFYRMDVSATRKLHFGSLKAPLKKKKKKKPCLRVIKCSWFILDKPIY